MRRSSTCYILGLNLILAGFSDQAVTALGLYYKWQTFFFIPLGAMQTFIVPVVSFNSSGKQIGKLVSDKLDIPFYYKEMTALAAQECGLAQEFISDLNQNAPKVLHDLYLSTRVVQHAIAAQHKVIERIAENGSCVIVGRAADHVLRNHENIVRIFIYAPEEYRIGRVMEVYDDSREEAERNIHHSDTARASYYHNISGNTWGDRHHYDLLINSSCGVQATAEWIVQYLSARNNKNER